VRSVSESTPTAPDGSRLVKAAQGGDPEAIRTLWEEHRRWIAAVLLAHKPAFEDLDDLLQEVAVTIVSKLDTLRDEANLRAWLRTVALNIARAAGRSGRYRPRTELPDHDLHDPNGSADDPVTQDEHTCRLLRRLAQLPESYREPLMLRATRGLASRQIGEILGIPQATVDTRIARARRMLREATDDGQDGNGMGTEQAVVMRIGDHGDRKRGEP
jgi:RNA polymerase sigma-70 factor (ECF subfamily)